MSLQKLRHHLFKSILGTYCAKNPTIITVLRLAERTDTIAYPLDLSHSVTDETDLPICSSLTWIVFSVTSDLASGLF
jgi:hypothetical protein